MNSSLEIPDNLSANPQMSRSTTRRRSSASDAVSGTSAIGTRSAPSGTQSAPSRATSGGPAPEAITGGQAHSRIAPAFGRDSSTTIVTFSKKPPTVKRKLAPGVPPPNPIKIKHEDKPPKIVLPNPVEERAKEARTSELIKRGDAFSMIHLFPDVVAAHPIGPLNLDREKWEIDHSFAEKYNEPLTEIGWRKRAQWQAEKAAKEAEMAAKKKNKNIFRKISNIIKRNKDNGKIPLNTVPIDTHPQSVEGTVTACA